MRFNLAGLIIPETWDSLEQFVHWYRVNQYPFRIPSDSQTFVTDVSYSMIIFRQDVYAVELYVGAPSLKGVQHAKHKHPFEHMTLICGGELYGRRGVNMEDDPPFSGPLAAGSLSAKLGPNDWHQLTTPSGFVLLTFTKWNNKEDITSAVVEWDGTSLGPIHDTLLNKGN